MWGGSFVQKVKFSFEYSFNSTRFVQKTKTSTAITLECSLTVFPFKYTLVKCKVEVERRPFPCFCNVLGLEDTIQVLTPSLTK